MQKMSESTHRKQLFLKGFKIDRKKLLEYCYPTEEDPENTRYYGDIIGILPRTSYKYIGAGFEEDGEFCLIVVMEDGWDKDELQKMEMPFCEEMLVKASKSVLTEGVWLNWD
jgi:hypothetical protein